MHFVEPEPMSGCWLWIGFVNQTTGYGQFTLDGRPRTAHSASYIIQVGPIPPGCEICHTCDVRPCVNVAHLYAGTHSDNMRDAVRRGRLRSPFLGNTNRPYARPTS